MSSFDVPRQDSLFSVFILGCFQKFPGWNTWWDIMIKAHIPAGSFLGMPKILLTFREPFQIKNAYCINRLEERLHTPLKSVKQICINMFCCKCPKQNTCLEPWPGMPWTVATGKDAKQVLRWSLEGSGRNKKNLPKWLVMPAVLIHSHI